MKRGRARRRAPNGLAVDLNREIVPQRGATVKNVDRELLRKRIRLVTHGDAHAEVAEFGVFGDGSGAGQRLRQAANHQTDRVLDERKVVGIHRGGAGLLHVLRTKHEEVFDLPDGSVDNRAKAGVAAVLELTEAWNL